MVGLHVLLNVILLMLNTFFLHSHQVSVDASNGNLPRVACSCKFGQQHGVPCRHSLAVLQWLVINGAISSLNDALRENIKAICRKRQPFSVQTSMRVALAVFGLDSIPLLVTKVPAICKISHLSSGNQLTSWVAAHKRTC